MSQQRMAAVRRRVQRAGWARATLMALACGCLLLGLPAITAKADVPDGTSSRPAGFPDTILMAADRRALLPTVAELSAIQPLVSRIPGFRTSLAWEWTVSQEAPALQVGGDQGLAVDQVGIEFRQISLEDGLSQSSVIDVVQDRLGFIWLATGAGLDRYDGYTFRHYAHDPEDTGSLGPGSISELHCDQAGRIWIRKGTGSLDRYDSETGQFVHYDLATSLDGEATGLDFVWDIYEDRSGRLWAGTYRSGLYRYDAGTDQFIAYRHDPDEPTSLSDNRVYAVHEDSAGALWVGTLQGLNRLDLDTGRFIRYNHDPDDDRSLGAGIVQEIHEDKAGRLWVTTFGVGLEQFDRQRGEVVARYQHDPADPATIDRTDAITGIYEDGQGFLWITHFDGRLDRFNPETGTFRRFRHDAADPWSVSDGGVSFVAEDRTGRLWVGTFAGLDRYDAERDGFFHYRHDPQNPASVSGNTVISFYEDRSGVLYFGTDGRGLSIYAPQRRKFAHFRLEPRALDSETNNYVQAIAQDRAGDLWLGTSAGLNRVDGSDGQLARYRHNPDDPHSLAPGEVWSILQDEQDRLWVGLSTGLDRYDPQLGSFVHHLPAPEGGLSLQIGAVRSIAPAGSGDLWLGVYRMGLCRFAEGDQDCTYHLPDPDDQVGLLNRISLVYRDRGGQVWVGTDGGLLEFDPDSKEFVTYEHLPGIEHSLAHNSVKAIYRDRSGRLWIGTAGGGLDRFDPTIGGFQHYTQEDGLPSDAVLAILEDAQGLLWLGTSAGLSQFDPETGTFRNFDSGDGLQSNEFSQGAAFQGPNGQMYFGGVNGYNAFHPEQISENPHRPPVVLTALTQGGWPLAVDKPLENLAQISMRWPNNYFEFEFAALDYTDPAKNQYAYMLEGFRDDGWEFVGPRRFGRYTNLPGGTYTLRLKGSNSDGVWNEEGVAIQVRVTPPFWATWWFRGVLLAVAVGGVLTGYRWRIRSVEARSQELESVVEERTRALAQRTRELRQRTQETEERKQELEALYRADSELHRHLDMEEVLQALVDIAVDILGADKSSLLTWDGHREKLAVRVARGYRPETLAEMVYAGQEGTVGKAAHEGEMVVVEDAQTDPRVTKRATVIEPEGIRSYVQVPIQAGGEVLCVYSADYVRQRSFGDDEKRIFQSLAQRGSLAIENALLYEQTQEAVAGQERSRLARELHDAVTQTLFSASLIAEALPELWENDPEEGKQLLQELRQLSRGAMAEMRTLLLELRPTALVETSLSELLRQLGDAVAGRTGMSVEVQATGHCGLSPEVHVALYRIAQEALNNVVKHSAATQVSVVLECTPQPGPAADKRYRQVRLEVTDNGRGFRPDRVRQDRLGLGIIRERAQAIGAAAEIASEPGQGTHLTVQWEGQE